MGSFLLLWFARGLKLIGILLYAPFIAIIALAIYFPGLFSFLFPAMVSGFVGGLLFLLGNIIYPKDAWIEGIHYEDATSSLNADAT